MCLYCHVAVDCGPLPEIEDGEISFSAGNFFNSTATYSCNDTLALTLVGLGGLTRKCEADAKWTGVDPTCEGKFQYLVLPSSGVQKYVAGLIWQFIFTFTMTMTVLRDL